MPLRTADRNFSRRLPAQLDSVRELKESVKEMGLAVGLTEDVLLRIELALEEILVNIVSYAYSEQEQPGWVEVNCRTEGAAGLTLQVRDAGRPFDPLELSQPDLDIPLAEREVGGLGVFLVRKMADRLRYERRAGVNILTLGFDSPKPAGTGSQRSDRLPADRGET
jgi:serine/threonine-protein kinase RsbW